VPRSARARARRSLSRKDLQTRFERSVVNLSREEAVEVMSGEKERRGEGVAFSRLINCAPSCKSISTEIPMFLHLDTGTIGGLPRRLDN